jgi:hypothetical protein
MIAGLFGFMIITLACAMFGPPPEGYPDWNAWETAQVANRTLEAQKAVIAQTAAADASTKSAAESIGILAAATADINNSSNSAQGGANIYIQGREDGYEDGYEDSQKDTTIQSLVSTSTQAAIVVQTKDGQLDFVFLAAVMIIIVLISIIIGLATGRKIPQ